MIIKRLFRLFSRRDPMPKPEDQYKLDENLARIYNVKPKLIIESTKLFDQDYEKLTLSEKNLVKKFKKDLKDGNFYNEGEDSGDNHFLAGFSNTKSLNPFHRLSRKINRDDRFNYLVYRPILFKNDKGQYEYNQKVVLESCKEHKLNGGKTY